MRLAIEFSADAERDFDLIVDHLFESYLVFGERTEEALDHAAFCRDFSRPSGRTMLRR